METIIKGFLLKINKMILFVSMIIFAGNLQASLYEGVTTEALSVLSCVNVYQTRANTYVITEEDHILLDADKKKKVDDILVNSRIALIETTAVGLLLGGVAINAFVTKDKDIETHALMTNALVFTSAGLAYQLYCNCKLRHVKNSIQNQVVDKDVEAQNLHERLLPNFSQA